MKKSIPWIISIVLAVVLMAVFFHYEDVIKERDIRLDAASAKLSALTAESDAKLREANAKAERAASAVQQLATEARSRIETVTQEASQRLAAANLPEATVAVSTRKAVLSSGNVAILKNTSDESIGIFIVATRPSVNRQRRFEVTLDPQSAKEIGEREGWAFVPGDTVTVEQPGHKSRIFTL